MTVINSLHKNLIAPFQLQRLRALFIAGVIYTFCNEFVSLHQAIFFTKASWQQGVAFIAIVNVISAFLIPLLLSCYQHSLKTGLLFAWTLFSAFIVLLVWGIIGANPYAQAMGLAFMQCLYWSMFHTLLLRRSTERIRAYQLSAYSNLITFTKLSASLLVGLVYGHLSPTLLCGLVIVGQAFVFWLLWLRFARQRKFLRLNQEQDLMVLAKQEPQLLAASTIQAAIGFIVNYLAPAWMILLGFSAFNIGAMPFYIFIVTLLLSPLMNRATHQSRGKDIAIASIGLGLCFAPWLIISSSWLMYVTQTIRTLSWQFLDVGILHRWYKLRTINGIALREVMTGLGRLIGAVLIAPFLWWHFPTFIVLGTALSLSLLVLAFQRNNK